jgi:hypothetical protein
MGFGAQIKGLQETQREQAQRILDLETENKTLKTMRENTDKLAARVEVLEQRNADLNARRREAVSQFFNLRTLHQEASNAFHMRASDIQPDDLEGILCVYGTSTTTVLNHHQRAIGQMSSQMAMATHAPPVSQIQQPIGPTPLCYQYPPGYNGGGWCTAHGIPYPCRMCGQ